MLTLWPVKAPRSSARFDLVGLIERLLGGRLKDGDVLVISSKFLAISEGRTVPLKGVRPTVKAKELARSYHLDAGLCELVLRESDLVIGGISGFLLTLREGLLTPNAGIDKSNIQHGRVVLYPRRASSSAERIREAIKFDMGVEVAIVVCDSRLMPTRRGTVGVALASSGLEAVLDLRGKNDLFGNVLRVTSQAIADDLSSSAQLLMGESDEGVPIVLVRGLSTRLLRDRNYPASRFSIPIGECVYMRSLGYAQDVVAGGPNTLLRRGPVPASR
jgi:coenzyme F420-0:L-glutamate ligase/coenzyme F420-1:gamma-L-glutamate ligase